MQHLIISLKRAIIEDEQDIKILYEKFTTTIDLISEYIEERDKITDEIFQKEENIKDVKLLIDFIEKNSLQKEDLNTIDINLMKFILKELFRLDNTSYECSNFSIEDNIHEFLHENICSFERLLEYNKELAKDE